jgi:hypothetical protein
MSSGCGSEGFAVTTTTTNQTTVLLGILSLNHGFISWRSCMAETVYILIGWYNDRAVRKWKYFGRKQWPPNEHITSEFA